MTETLNTKKTGLKYSESKFLSTISLFSLIFWHLCRWLNYSFPSSSSSSSSSSSYSTGQEPTEPFLLYGQGVPGSVHGIPLTKEDNLNSESMKPITGLDSPRAVDFYGQDGYVYYSDSAKYQIGRQMLNGSGHEIILDESECHRYYPKFSFGRMFHREDVPSGGGEIFFFQNWKVFIGLTLCLDQIINSFMYF